VIKSLSVAVIHWRFFYMVGSDFGRHLPTVLSGVRAS